MRKTILIVESNVDGHYGVYLKKIVNFYLQRGIHIFLVVDDGPEAALFLENLVETKLLFNRIRVIQLPLLYRPKKYNFFTNFWSQLRFWNACKKTYSVACNRNKIDFVFIPYLDRLIYAVSILGSPFKTTPFSGIVMRPIVHHHQMGIKTSDITIFRKFSLKSFLFDRVIKLNQLQSIFTIDFSFWNFAQLRVASKWEKIQYFPDPVDQIHVFSKEVALQHFGICADETVLLLYGSIDMRKGVIGALEWTIEARSKGINVHLLILGSQSEEVRQYLRKSTAARALVDAGSLYLKDSFITTNEEALAFSAADIVWLNYNNFDQMSGVMVKAGMFDLCMALPDKGLMGWYKERLLKSDKYMQFSIPRLKADPKLNPFAEHTWENSLLKLSALIK